MPISRRGSIRSQSAPGEGPAREIADDDHGAAGVALAAVRAGDGASALSTARPGAAPTRSSSTSRTASPPPRRSGRARWCPRRPRSCRAAAPMSSSASTGRCAWPCATSRRWSAPGVQALALPKAESAEHVQLVAEIIDELEAERGMAHGTTQDLAMVETCGGVLPHRRDRPGPPAARRAQPRGRGFRHSRPACCPSAEGAVHAEADVRLRRPRRRHHADGVYRHGRRVSRPRRLPRDDPPLAPARLHRRLGHPPEPGRDPQRGIPPERRRGRARRAASSPPTTRRWPKGSARSPSTAR